MTGNPCTSYRGYRSWVICMLPGLEELDGTRVTRSERLRALQELSEASTTVMADQQQAMGKGAITALILVLPCVELLRLSPGMCNAIMCLQRKEQQKRRHASVKKEAATKKTKKTTKSR